MNRTVLSLFAATTLMMSAASAQITYEYGDLPVIGDQITRYRDTMTVYGPGPSGADQQWNFPSPVTHDVLVTSVVTPASTPHASQFGGSNMAMTNDNLAFLYFSNSANAMIATGAAGDLLQNGSTIVTVFNPTLTVHNLPRNYDDASDDTYYFEAIANNITVPVLGVPLTVNAARVRHYGHVYDSTDSYGQITTPVGTYECLRVKSTDHTIDSVWTKLFSFSQWTLQTSLTGRDTSISYSWLAKETKLAVAELTFDTLDNPKNFTWTSIPPLTTGFADAGRENVRIYPQPAAGLFTVQLPDGSEFHTAELFALDGRRVHSIAILNRDRIDMEVQNLVPGMYLLQLVSAIDSETVTHKIAIR
ncbi:MAG: T9SS type A sorting domain-containing protein [Flavobacteriales bacterium]|nr:T9SS type A sorting domain-containing protein [Flavobacteriales bacterium]